MTTSVLGRFRGWVSVSALTILAAAGVTAVTVSGTVGTPKAAAAPCPDVQVFFARGTDEPPGLGQVGEVFVQGIRDRTGRDVAASAVNYPAHQDIGPGVNDLTAQLNSFASRCPNTRIVVGGYSLGAAVTNRVLNDPLAPGVDDRIAAVVLFGNASRLLDVPLAPGPEFADRFLDVCNPGDPICSGGPFALSHLQLAYVAGGGLNSGVDFAISKL
ncbi:cutinase family protein [Mycobacterium sp. AZCC_0083]|uniref:cutinase family protein n=1 Tax=Mycobacterium sp. AZCC_0083 TaxID=2735882 RepID=UPI001618C241|nr:cutinase family protein [Mycobacterium sp. AZCC_0083]MBB5164458.1 cutinase [Mycobacterium sp. AZCC_0083]